MGRISRLSQVLLALTSSCAAQQYYGILNQWSGLVIDDTNYSTQNGTIMQQYKWADTSNQQWQLAPLNNGNFEIKNLLSGLVLDDTNYSTQNGTYIQQWQWDDTTNQEWQVIPVGNGYYEIKNVLSGLVLDVTGGSTQNGALIDQYQWSGSSVQEWSFITATNAGTPDAQFTMGSLAINGQSNDSGGNPITYAYGASVINVSGPWWMYFCSHPVGNGSASNEDAIRYSDSSDGKTWSTPSLALTVSGGTSEGSTCDPSVVAFNGYYYMFYGGDPTYEGQKVGGAIFVARSTNQWGPFLKYTYSGTWAQNPSNPAVLITPKHPYTGYYGVGQPTVVVVNGKLYMWYTDTTLNYPNSQTANTLFVTSTDGVHWSSPTVTNIGETGGEVKYDSVIGQFVFFNTESSQPSWPSVRTSSDGVTWSGLQQVGGSDLPYYAGAVGVSSDESGWIMPNDVYLYFGAQYGLSQTSPPNYGEQSIYWGSITGTWFN